MLKTKGEIKKLLDKFKKRIKYLNLKNIDEEQNKNDIETQKKKYNEGKKRDEMVEDDSNTAMSDVTAKTTNSITNKNKDVPKYQSPSNTTRRKTEHSTKLDSLGKTRKAKTNENQIVAVGKGIEENKEIKVVKVIKGKMENKENEKNKKVEITQDEQTIMSEVTKEENEHRSTAEKRTHKENEGYMKEMNHDDNTIISEITMTQQKK